MCLPAQGTRCLGDLATATGNAPAEIKDSKIYSTVSSSDSSFKIEQPPIGCPYPAKSTLDEEIFARDCYFFLKFMPHANQDP